MKINRRCAFAGMTVAAFIATIPIWAAPPSPTAVPAQLTQMVVAVLPAHPGGSAPIDLQAQDLTVIQGKTQMPVLRLERLAFDLAGMQLFILLDDSTRSSSLSLHLPELREFIKSLPATTQVAVGYVRNGTLAQPAEFTTEHQNAIDSLRLPLATPGGNGSPYFGLSDLVKHWPSKELTGRRAVLMLTDGEDRYYGSGTIDDPYVDASIRDALQNGVAVYSIYLRGAGLYGGSEWVKNVAQSRLIEVGKATGGFAYFEELIDPVTIAPFLNDFHERLENQYKLTFATLKEHGLQPVKLRTELHDVKVDYPAQVFVR